MGGQEKVWDVKRMVGRGEVPKAKATGPEVTSAVQRVHARVAAVVAVLPSTT